MTYDAIVVGLGAMGSATTYQLARRGAKVLGIEAFGRAHDLGSSGGLTRIIRLAYFEHPAYVPLLRAAWQLWPQIEAESGARLLEVTGGLYIGRKGSDVLDGALLSAQTHGLAHEVLDPVESQRRFPALRLDADMQVLHEPLAGILFAPRCIDAQLELAEQHDAELHFEERVISWQPDGDALRVNTSAGTYRARRLVLSVGAWLPKLAPELRLPLSVERNSLFWFAPLRQPEIFGADRLPVWIMELDAEHAFYGFPMLPASDGMPAQGIKVARHHGGQTVDPDSIDRLPRDADEQVVRGFIERHMPDANGERLDGACACTPIRPTSTSSSTATQPTSASSSPRHARATASSSRASSAASPPSWRSTAAPTLISTSCRWTASQLIGAVVDLDLI